jgi:spore coat protein U-like protein
MRAALVAAALLALLAPGPAGAASCTVSSTGLAFGSYDFLSSAPLDSAATITWSCDVPTSINIALSKGAAQSFSPRRLTSDMNAADYNLYLDVARNAVWGDGTAGTSTWTGSGSGASVPVYGRVPPRQALPGGSYTDTIVVTIAF